MRGRGTVRDGPYEVEAEVDPPEREKETYEYRLARTEEGGDCV